MQTRQKVLCSLLLSKNRERIGLSLGQDGVLLRNGAEKVELARPLLLSLSFTGKAFEFVPPRSH